MAPLGSMTLDLASEMIFWPDLWTGGGTEEWNGGGGWGERGAWVRGVGDGRKDNKAERGLHAQRWQRRV